MGHRFILTAGGTGGHIFPALSVLEQLQAKGHEVLFITDHRFYGYQPHSDPSLSLKIIQSATLSGSFPDKVWAGFKIMAGCAQAIWWLKQYKPSAVAGFGGYPSFPMMLAAQQLNIPTMIHEQNALMGKANRMFLPKASHIATSYQQVDGIPKRFQHKVVETGNPVREVFQHFRNEVYAIPEKDAPFHILVLGGSQGAKILGDVVPAALNELPKTLRARIHMTIQCRLEQCAAMREALGLLGLGGFEISHFYQDVAERMAKSHVIISRAGASSVAELMMVGRPAILVPYAKAAGDHQTKNANMVSDAGGGWCIPEKECSAMHLATMLRALIEDPDRLSGAATIARSLAHEHAAKQLSELLIAM